MFDPANIYALLASRILILDGAMGTLLQEQRFSEADFRGNWFAEHPKSMKGNYDMLSLTQPETIRNIHRSYLSAGADIIRTNTFNSNRISQLEYGTERMAYALNISSALLAREVVDAYKTHNPGKAGFVAGTMGPTSQNVSLSGENDRRGSHISSFQKVYRAYYEQALGLMGGGVDLLILETIVDISTAEAGIKAIQDAGKIMGTSIPLILSRTITNDMAHSSPEQEIEAFLNFASHAKPLSIGFNCAPGAKRIGPYLEKLSERSPHYTCVYPNAGLPDQCGKYNETPNSMGYFMNEYIKKGWVNIIGGCCGTNPGHIHAFTSLARHARPRKISDTN